MSRNSIALVERGEVAEAAAPVGRPERIDPGDMDYHAYVGRLSARIAALQQELQGIQAAKLAWGAYLGEKYGLPDGTDVLPDGAFRYSEAGA